MQVVWLIIGLILCLHVVMCLIYFTINYRKRMAFLQVTNVGQKIPLISKVYHFAILLIIALIFGSFLLTKKAYTLYKFIRQFGSLKFFNDRPNGKGKDVRSSSD